MKSFLEYVAEDLLSKYGTDMSRLAVVFPNKRASLFLNDYLARHANKPIWSPAYITISDLFRSHSSLTVADPIKLVCDLHKSFTSCTGIDETLDHFYGWGQLLLSDFDDIDKNMAPADKVFANLTDIHEYDDISYLTEEQQQIIRRFFSNFSADHNSELKRRFLQLWSHIGDIYHDYRHRLTDQRLAYEGMLYRHVSEAETVSFDHEKYIFVGFNMLQQVEQRLFHRLKREGKAAFYWDFDRYYMQHHEAGHYIAQYLADFPNELDREDADIYNNFRRQKDLTYISAPTENIQARYVSQWLREVKSEERNVNSRSRIADGRRTAVVLCNEGLLQTVIHCLPDEVDRVNITTGYPLQQSPVASLIAQLINLRTYGYNHQRNNYRLRYVNAVLRHPYARYVSPMAPELMSHLNQHHIYYPSADQLCTDEGLSLLFSAPASSGLTEVPGEMLSWLTTLLQHIARNSKDNQDPLFQESVFRMYTLLNRLSGLCQSGDLRVDIITLQRLITQLIQTTSIPFHGEPAVGIQVMGVLETRNLDFDHVLLLSCNEGNLPKGVSDTSFIPYSIRKAYGLTTIDHKVAIYAYYFHRLLQRAGDVTIVYNNATSDGHTGEMSRFMLQLMVESGQPIKKLTLQAGQTPNTHHPSPITKTPEVIRLLRERLKDLVSPSAIATYLRCQLRFFYRYACGLEQYEEVEDDSIDNRIFGNIFHRAAEIVYQQLTQQSPVITAGDIGRLLKEKVGIERAVDQAFKEELFQIKDPTRQLPPFDGLQLINREVIIRYVHQLLEVDSRLTPFTILGLEKLVSHRFTIHTPDGDFETTVGGFIDRLDMITTPDGQERIRVIDYKTGAARLHPLPDVAAIFDPEQLKNHNDYYLQTFLYSIIVDGEKQKAADARLASATVSPALLFIQHAGVDDYDPTLCLGKEPVTDINEVRTAYLQHFHEITADIFNPSLSFMPTSDDARCNQCPFKTLCR